MRHCKKRHYRAGIEEARRQWGDEAAVAARQHVIADVKIEGWTENEPFPKNEQDYVRTDLF